MVKPNDPLKIKLQDLTRRYGSGYNSLHISAVLYAPVKQNLPYATSNFSVANSFLFTVCALINCCCFCSGQGDTVVNILTDLNGFWNYENREVLSAETDNENEEDATEC